jgi:hypothetical protein
LFPLDDITAQLLDLPESFQTVEPINGVPSQVEELTTTTPHVAVISGCHDTSSQRQGWEVKNGRKRFTVYEDEKICHYVSVHGAREWEILSEMIPGRDGRSIRLRWINTHSQESKGELSEEEDQRLLDCVSSLGKKWAKIRKEYFPDFSDVYLKNRFNKLERRAKKEKQSRPSSFVVESRHNQNSTSSSLLTMIHFSILDCKLFLNLKYFSLCKLQQC